MILPQLPTTSDAAMPSPKGLPFTAANLGGGPSFAFLLNGGTALPELPPPLAGLPMPVVAPGGEGDAETPRFLAELLPDAPQSEEEEGLREVMAEAEALPQPIAFHTPDKASPRPPPEPNPAMPAAASPAPASPELSPHGDEQQPEPAVTETPTAEQAAPETAEQSLAEGSLPEPPLLPLTAAASAPPAAALLAAAPLADEPADEPAAERSPAPADTPESEEGPQARALPSRGTPATPIRPTEVPVPLQEAPGRGTVLRDQPPAMPTRSAETAVSPPEARPGETARALAPRALPKEPEAPKAPPGAAIAGIPPAEAVSRLAATLQALRNQGMAQERVAPSLGTGNEGASPPGSELGALRGPAFTATSEARPGQPAFPTPHAPLPEQLGLRIQRAVVEGQQRMTVQLHPAEMGRVDVRLEFTTDGVLRALITAERPEALDLLQRDARGLERALSDAGLKTDGQSLSFDLREQGQQRERAEQQRGEQPAPGEQQADRNGGEQPQDENGGARSYRGLVNLSV